MKKIKALVWKEWRESRTFFILGMIIIILSRIISQWVISSYPESRLGLLMTLPHVIIPIFACFIATIPFGREFEQKTSDFLLSNAIKPTYLFFIKYIVNITLFSILVISGLFLYSNMQGGTSIHYDMILLFKNPGLNSLEPPSSLIFMWIIILIGLHSSILFSSITIRQILPSIFLSPILYCFATMLSLICFIGFITKINIVVINLLLATPPLILIIYSLIIWIKSICRSEDSWKITRRVSTMLITPLIMAIIIYTVNYLMISMNLNNAIAKAKKVGMIFDVDELKPVLIPEKENSLNYYKKGFKLVESTKIQKIINNKKRSDGDTREIMEDSDVKKLFEIIDMASSFKEFSSGIKHYRDDHTYKPIIDIRDMALLNNERVNYYFAIGKTEEAIKALDSTFAIIKALKREPGWWTFYIRNSIITSTLQSIDRVPPNLIPIAYYKKWMKDIDCSNEEIKHQLIISLSFTYHSYVQSMVSHQMDYNDYKLCNRFLKLLYSLYLSTPIIKREAITYLIDSINGVEKFNLTYKDKKKYLNKYWRKQTRVSYTYTHFSIPFTLRKFEEFKVKRTLFNTFLALKIYKAKHGAYPAKLAELVPNILSQLPMDSYNGKILKYKIKDDGFHLYSVGENLKDDKWNIKITCDN